jgi:hypothetical protein
MDPGISRELQYAAELQPVGSGLEDACHAERLPTSQKLNAIFGSAPLPFLTLEWVLGSLGERSFGLIMLLLGLVAMLPGVCVLGGLGLAILGLQMTMAKEKPLLPGFLVLRSLPADKVLAVLGRIIPPIKFLEKFIRPRWHVPFIATRRLVGLVIILLAATVFVPIPLSNVLPGAMALLVAFAYLEEDGLLLSVALAASIASLLITGMEVWGTAKGAEVLLRL